MINNILNCVNNFLNAYVKDARKDVQYDNCVYLLFQPEDLDVFKDFQHEICVYLEGFGEGLVCFDILSPGDELDADHSDDYEIDFAVFDEQDKHITYDISKKQYNHCENKARIAVNRIGQ